jgi:TMEM175 potassium channel family protein
MPSDSLDSAISSEPSQGPPAAEDQDDAGDERLITLTDGVVAIALTLLILGIVVPSPDTLRNPDSVSALAGALGHTVDGWISYAISFYMIAQFWLLHRQLFRGVRGGYHDGMAAWNFLFLFTITVMPFTTDLIGKYPENPLPVIILSANLILATLARFGMLSFARRHGLLDPRLMPARERSMSLQGAINIVFYVLAIPVALASPDLGKVCWLGLALSPRLSIIVNARLNARRTQRDG